MNIEQQVDVSDPVLVNFPKGATGVTDSSTPHTHIIFSLLHIFRSASVVQVFFVS